MRYIHDKATCGLHGPFNNKAEAAAYAKIMGIGDYELMFKEEAIRVHSPDQFRAVNHLRLTKN